MTSVHIRKANIDDAPAVFAIRREAILAQCRDHYPPGDLAIWTSGELSAAFAARVADQFLVALVDGQVVGSGMIDLSTGKIDAVFVHPACMRHGVGRAVMEHLETLARGAGLPAIHLESTLNAAPFYRAQGFEGESQSLYQSSLGVSLACVCMVKHL
ncbi:GNAT family N-acetyltransferase [Dyella solisilvae]|uniref:GNAT family N-acetyltransferase n=1 Tax=Dyella solisilvae TaxID=1920168 RepID=A0A370K6X5_9GAMM|nr:GNAT family N-acetyltransferase [Dyella solisilvae]RDI98399.1 GNAT family N-acetyltransferase [Dyella solisilvae]